MAKMLVRINGKYLEYIRPDLQNEKICIIAIKNDFRSIKFVMKKLLTCEMMVLAICNSIQLNTTQYNSIQLNTTQYKYHI